MSHSLPPFLGLVPRYPLQKPPSRKLEGSGGEGGGDEIGALVSFATKGKPAVSPGKDSPMPPVPSPPPIDNGETGAQAAVENGEAGAQAAIQNGEADAEVEQGEDTRVDSPSPPVDSPEPEAARKRSADGPEGSPVPKRAKHTDTHGQSDDGEITLGEDSRFKFCWYR